MRSPADGEAVPSGDDLGEPTGSWRVRVVIPVRDEEALLPACLEAVGAAIARLRAERPATPAAVTVVLDSCSDDSAAVAAAYSWVEPVVVGFRRVGAARAAGVVHATRADHDPDRVWLACTDADSLVPEDWLAAQLDLADRGHEVVIGTVEPREGDLSPATRAAWRSRHERRDGHGHVHGANLGLTLEAYRLAGGFPAVTAHEDVILVERLRQAGLRWFAFGGSPVVTSGRAWGRAPEGFAAYVRDLEDLSEPSA